MEQCVKEVNKMKYDLEEIGLNSEQIREAFQCAIVSKSPAELKKCMMKIIATANIDPNTKKNFMKEMA